MSPITVTLRVPRAAAPIPWKKRRARSTLKSRAKAQAPHLSAGDTELPYDGREGWRYARSSEYRHQRHAPQNVEVAVFIDPAYALVSLGLRSHDRRIYQVARSEVGKPFGLRLSARRRADLLKCSTDLSTDT